MNVLILFGSPKRNGYTQKLTDAFLEGLEKPYTTKYVRLFDLSPVPCNDCGYCKRAEGCSKKDLDAFMESYLDADLVIIATPIYLYSMPAPLKALFDRFQRFFNAHFSRNIAVPIPKAKQAVILLTAGSDGTIGKRVIEEQVKTAFSVMNTKVVASLLWNHTDQQTDPASVYQKATILSKQVSAQFN